MNKPTVLLDVDYTILDMYGVKRHISSIIDVNYGTYASSKFWQIYEQVRSDIGHIDSKEVAHRFAKAVNSENLASAVSAFVEVPFKKYLLPSASKLINYLSKNTNFIIFSEGDNLYQKTKLEKLDLYKVANDVFLSTTKIRLLPEIVKKYPKPFAIIDDKPSILDSAKEYLENLTTIWIRFGKYAEVYKTANADFETDDLASVIKFLEEKFGKVNN